MPVIKIFLWLTEMNYQLVVMDEGGKDALTSPYTQEEEALHQEANESLCRNVKSEDPVEVALEHTVNKTIVLTLAISPIRKETFKYIRTYQKCSM